MKKLKVIPILLLTLLLLWGCGETKVEISKDWEAEYGDSLILVDKNNLHDNADDYKGSDVMTIVTIDDFSDDFIKADDSKEDFFYDFVFNFNNSAELNGIEENKQVCIIGTVSDVFSFGSTVTLNDCHLVAYDDVSEYKDRINNSSNTKAKKKNKSKDTPTENVVASYKKECKTYAYNDIQRYPDNYDGKKIKMSGTVIQVGEGWFDTVTLRIQDNSGDIWYVNYAYSDGERKLLEDDVVNVWGECQGTKTYETILGDSETIPYIEAEYIEIN